MKKTEIAIPENNSIKVIMNVNGKIIEAEKPLNEEAAKKVLSKISKEDKPIECNGFDYDMASQCISEFIPNAMIVGPSDFFDPMTPVSIGISSYYENFDNNAEPIRSVWVKSDNEDSVPMMEPAIIGDKYGPVGMFIPFTITSQAANWVSDFFQKVSDRKSASYLPGPEYNIK